MTKLHFSRIRPMDVPRFVDPQADIIEVVGRAISAAIADIEIAAQKLGITEEDTAKLVGLLQVFSIRLRQDPASLVDQMTEFTAAFKAVPEKVTALFMQLFGYAILVQYALFMRRDAKFDNRDVLKIMPSTMLLLNSFATLDTTQKVHQFAQYCSSMVRDVLDTVNAQKSVLDQAGVSALAPLQDGTCIQLPNIKAAAFKSVGGSASDSWQTLSQKCAVMLQADKGTDREQVAAALAYPSYKYPFLDAQLEVQDGSTDI